MFDLATKHQDTLTEGSAGYSSASGRNAIATLASQQWNLGEQLTYKGLTSYTNGGSAGDGAEASNAIAKFHDGTTQRFDEAKFAYDCAQHGFSHVVITSSEAAA